MEFDMTQLSLYLTGTLVVVFSGVAVYLARLVKTYLDLGLSKFEENSPAIYNIISKIIRDGVLDAELKWLKGEISDKKEYVIAYAKTIMSKYGLDKYFNLDEVISQIEIVVYDEFNKNKKGYKPK